MEWVLEMWYIEATGALGAGVDRDWLFAAVDEDPRFIPADAGTTHAGAFALGAAHSLYETANPFLINGLTEDAT